MASACRKLLLGRTTVDPGVGLDYKITLSPDVDNKWSSCLFSDDSWGFFNPFGKPWAEAVRGKLEVKATVRLAMDEEDEKGTRVK